MSIRNRQAEFAELSVQRLCRVCGVTRSQYYRSGGVPAEPLELDAMRKLLMRFPAYGYRRVAAQLRLPEKRVRTIMGRYCLKPKRRRRHPRRLAVFGGGANLVKANLPSAEGQILASDVTAVRLYGSKHAYFAAIIDLFTREIVGYCVSDRNDTALASQALAQAALMANLKPGWIHHSDRGAAYTSHLYLGQVSRLDGSSSFSDPGCPTQNAFIESFFNSFKREEGGLDVYTDLADATRAIDDYVSTYNTERLHSRIGNKPPATFRQENL